MHTSFTATPGTPSCARRPEGGTPTPTPTPTPTSTLAAATSTSSAKDRYCAAPAASTREPLFPSRFFAASIGILAAAPVTAAIALAFGALTPEIGIAATVMTVVGLAGMTAD
jgi:hypothetical protein